MTAVTMMVAVAAQIIGGNGWQSVVLVVVGGVGGGGGCQSRKIQFLQLYCSVCHHSLSRLNTRAE